MTFFSPPYFECEFYYAILNKKLAFKCDGGFDDVVIHANMIDYPAKNDVTEKFFGDIGNPAGIPYFGNIINPDDFVYLWFYNHGYANSPSASVCVWGTELLDDHELENWIDDWNYNRIAFTFGECYCGGMLDWGLQVGTKSPEADDTPDNLDDLPGDVIISVSQDYRESHSRANKGKTWFGFVYQHNLAFEPIGGDLMKGTAIYTNGLHNGLSPDSNGDGLVSLYEAYIYAEANNDAKNGNGDATAGFEYDDISNYYDGTYLRDLGKITFL